MDCYRSQQCLRTYSGKIAITNVFRQVCACIEFGCHHHEERWNEDGERAAFPLAAERQG